MAALFLAAVIAGVAVVGARERREPAHRRARHAPDARCTPPSGRRSRRSRAAAISCSSWSRRSHPGRRPHDPPGDRRAWDTLFLIASSDVTSSLTPDTTGFLRVRPPGLTDRSTSSPASPSPGCSRGPARGRMLGWAMVAVTMTGVILSLNRNMLLGLALGLWRRAALVYTAAASLRRHGRVTRAGGVGVRPDRQGHHRRVLSAIVSRISSITNYSQLQTQTSTTATTRTTSRSRASARTPSAAWSGARITAPCC